MICRVTEEVIAVELSKMTSRKVESEWPMHTVSQCAYENWINSGETHYILVVIKIVLPMGYLGWEIHY